MSENFLLIDLGVFSRSKHAHLRLNQSFLMRKRTSFERKTKGLFKISNDFNSQAVYYTHVTNKKQNNNIDFRIIQTLNPIRNCNDSGFLTLSNQR